MDEKCCCGNCGCNKRLTVVKLNKLAKKWVSETQYTCNNCDSENYGLEIGYADGCEEWTEK